MNPIGQPKLHGKECSTTGTILRAMRENGSPEPEFDTDDDRTSFLIRLPVHAEAARTGQVTGEVTPEVGRLPAVIDREMKRQELQQALGLKHEDHFRTAYLTPAIEGGLVEMTIPDKPTSGMQKYRLTAKGRAWVDRTAGEEL